MAIFRQNWEYLVDRFTLNDRYLGSMISTISKTFSTETKLVEVNNGIRLNNNFVFMDLFLKMEQFFAKYPEAGAGATARLRALETVKQNIKWLANYRKTVESWLSTVKK